MRLSSGFFSVLLIIWMGGSTYWYVCKIKDHCKKDTEELTVKTDENSEVEVTVVGTADEEIEMTEEEIVEDVKSKISEGYTIYYFPENSIENNNIEAAFDEFAENLKLYLDQNSDEKIEITGHTDDIGSDNANYKFGLKRAKFIKQIIVNKGIKTNRILVRSKGEKEPIASNDTDEGKEQNRRVVIKLIEK